MGSKKIKICWVANADTVIKFLLMPFLKSLQGDGYEVCVVCAEGKWVKEIENQGVKVKTIKIKRKITPLYDLITLITFWNYFRKEKFDVVHANNPKPGLLGQMAAKMAGVPIIVNTVHGFYFHADSPRTTRRFFIFIEKIAARFSNLIFFVNREDMKTAVNEKICREDIIRYLGGWVDLEKFNPMRFSKEFVAAKKEKLGIRTDQKVVGIVARLVEEKGYLELFKAFSTVLQRFPETVLLVVGPGESDKKDAITPEVVKNYGIEKNVIFLGERGDMNEIFSVMDIFVLPSYREGLGISILEASAMEKPVIATNIRGCREAVDDGITGMLVTVKDPDKLAEAILYFLGNPQKAAGMGKAGRIKVAKEFDERLVSDRIREEYKKLIRDRLR